VKEVYMRRFVELGNAMMRKEAVQNERSHLQPYDKANRIVAVHTWQTEKKFDGRCERTKTNLD
jgi:hypothetical protein